MPFKTKLHYMMHAIVATKVARVRQTAIAAGGHVTWRFSQVENPVRSLICSHADTSGGICEMVSAKWLEAHAKGDHIANWLEKGGPIDANKIRQLMQLFAIGTTMHPERMRGGDQVLDDTADDQDKATAIWLQTKGIVRKTGIVGVQFLHEGLKHVPSGAKAERNGRQRRVLARTLGEEIARGFGTYKTVGFSGPHFAHACAAWSHRDVTWFDPNFGEFWFEDRAAFIEWFPTFWHTAGYGTPQIGLSESYDVREYYYPLKRNAA
ncbi:MAG: YopT-type cysteine protease domain-containing protein [Labilithrix sp.]